MKKLGDYKYYNLGNLSSHILCLSLDANVAFFLCLKSKSRYAIKKFSQQTCENTHAR